MSTFISLRDANVEFPIFNASGRRFTNQILKVATGGFVGADPNGRIMVSALMGLNLEITAGEKVGIIGHNGSGKSTMLRLLAGIYEPSSGSAIRSGSISSLTDINLGIDPESTGKENIFLRGAFLGLHKREIQSKFNEIVDFSELGDFIQLPVRTYSTGMMLRLAFAVATVTNPQIIIMDEWLSVGDESFKNKAESRLQEMVDNSDILIIASHTESLLRGLCNRIIWLEHGKVIDDGHPEIVLPKYFQA